MRCYLPWTQAFVNANGVIAPCCAPLDMGNVAEKSLQTLFTGGEFNRLRADLSAGRRSDATTHCDNCYTIRKLAASKRTFDVSYALTSDNDATLAALESSGYKPFVDNYRLVRQAYLDGTPLPPDARPLRLEIQLGEHCDIRCIMCWQDHSRPRMLRSENYEQIREMLPYVVQVLFTGGEPTIFKEFWKLIETFREVAQPYAKLQMLSHGQHLRDNLHRFEGIGNISFSINVDGPTKEVYEKIRFGSSWEKMTTSLEALKEARKTQPGWFVNTTFLLMRSNIDLIEEAIEFAERYDASFGCGMIAGEYTPVAQCRTYFEENLFRFDHLGYSRDQIIARLEAALPRAEKHPHALAKANIEATIQQVRETRQIHVPADRAAEMRAMKDNNELSRAILALVIEDARQHRPSVEQLRGDLDNAEQMTGSHSDMSAKAAISLALRLMEDGGFDDAEILLRRAIATLLQLNDSDDRDIASAKFHLGRCLSLRGDVEVAPLREALDAFCVLLGRHNTQTAEAALELGKALNRVEKFSDAVVALEHAYEAYLKAYGKQEDSSYVAVSASELGKAYIGVERFAEAEKPLKKAVQMYEKMWGMEHSITAVAVHQLSQAQVGAGHHVEAMTLLNRYLNFYEEKYGEDNLLTQLTNGYLVQAEVAAQIAMQAAE